MTAPTQPRHDTAHCTHRLGFRQVRERHVGRHLVVAKLVALCEHEIVVDDEHLAEKVALPYFHMLERRRHGLHHRRTVEHQRDTGVRVALCILPARHVHPLRKPRRIHRQ